MVLALSSCAVYVRYLTPNFAFFLQVHEGGSYRSYTYLMVKTPGSKTKGLVLSVKLYGWISVSKKVDRGEAQDWVLVSSHVNGSACNPLTAAIFDPRRLGPSRGRRR